MLVFINVFKLTAIKLVLILNSLHFDCFLSFDIKVYIITLCLLDATCFLYQLISLQLLCIKQLLSILIFIKLSLIDICFLSQLFCQYKMIIVIVFHCISFGQFSQFWAFIFHTANSFLNGIHVLFNLGCLFLFSICVKLLIILKNLVLLMSINWLIIINIFIW